MGRLIPPIGARDHILGSPRAPVTLLEFGDYECPFCGRAQPIVREVLRRLGDRVLYGFRHFPVPRLHPHALLAAQAVEAAGAQGRFWAMHETLFDNQNALALRDLLGHARALGLDVARFGGDLDNGIYLEKVAADIASAQRSGVDGTPTFFIDEVPHHGSWDLDSLTEALERALAADRGAWSEAP
jgi:NhaA family Na+:H+ antiporter